MKEISRTVNSIPQSQTSIQEAKKKELIAANKAAANEILLRLKVQLDSQVYKITTGFDQGNSRK